ncbi:Glutathionyl-hydroquinone reductase [Purpureocillium takamizusanense]|uniref:Glutathionyl-hydroquinone reductase n=1 Tax=Purpureocillium takamizusanense TaxID=2060973 RepID=A0A9Q8V8B5_9HYPO|nr:Glutathionyl-hydroquinone reductase [Purpureocillium takamizusanense]UNI15381.1 Glutathionyl-hydroquinone reductase [Purpureocillium takamizusanense]
MASNTSESYHANGRFTRPESAFRSFISNNPSAQFPAEAGRYALYVSPGCPWAHRTLIVRLLKGLESIIDVYQVHITMGPEGWYFSGEGDSLPKDPLHGFKTLKQLYLKADPAYTGRYTVPMLWDKKADVPVNNESSEIIRMFYTEFDHLLPEPLREVNRPGGGLYPSAMRSEIDELNDWVYSTVNNGVYRTGFAKSQQAYDDNVHVLFASLDRLEAILQAHGKPFLLGDNLTEADIRLYTTMARFDVAYYTVFMCNLKSIRHDYPALHLWLRRLYWDQDVGSDLRGAFYRTTQPYISQYAHAYAHARRKIVVGEATTLVVPAGPAVLMEPLPRL